MYIHIGTDVAVKKKEIIAIIRTKGDKSRKKINSVFLQKKAEKGKLIDLSCQNEKSFVVMSDNVVYISPISPDTLIKRCKIADFQEG